MIGESHAPIAARLFALAPLVAGIAVLIVGNKLRGVARGSTGSAIGIACFAFLLVDVPLRSMLSNLPRIGRELSLAVIGLPIAGFMTMFAGILGLRHRPEYRPLSIVALVGGILFVLFLVIPWGEGISSMPILGVFKDPFEKLPADDRSDPLIQACAILSMLAVTAAAVQCVYFGATGKFSRGRAKLGLWLMVGSVFTAYLTMGLFLNYFLNLIAIGAKSSLLIAAFMYALKFSLWIVGLALLVPVGASELMLGLAERKYGADPGSGFAVQMQSAGAPFAPPSAQTIQPMAPMQPMQPMAPMPPMTPRGHVPRQH
jgi:hypothetical protein